MRGSRNVYGDVELHHVRVAPTERLHRGQAAVAADHAARGFVDYERLNLAETGERPANGVHVALTVLAGVGGVGVERLKWDALDGK